MFGRRKKDKLEESVRDLKVRVAQIEFDTRIRELRSKLNGRDTPRAIFQALNLEKVRHDQPTGLPTAELQYWHTNAISEYVSATGHVLEHPLHSTHYSVSEMEVLGLKTYLDNHLIFLTEAVDAITDHALDIMDAEWSRAKDREERTASIPADYVGILEPGLTGSFDSAYLSGIGWNLKSIEDVSELLSGLEGVEKFHILIPGRGENPGAWLGESRMN